MISSHAVAVMQWSSLKLTGLSNDKKLRVFCLKQLCAYDLISRHAVAVMQWSSLKLRGLSNDKKTKGILLEAVKCL